MDISKRGYVITHKYDVGALCNGILAGLVSITAGCGNMESGSAVATGLIGGEGWSNWLGKTHENLIPYIQCIPYPVSYTLVNHRARYVHVFPSGPCWLHSPPCKTPWLMLHLDRPSPAERVSPLEVLCIRQHPCCCKNSASMTLWTPVRSTASVEPGG